MKAGAKNIELLAIDANPIIAALLGGKAKKVILRLASSGSQLITTEWNAAEVREYIPALSRQYHLNMDDLYDELIALPIAIAPRSEYEDQMPDALARIGSIDKDDADLLALALKQKCPIWTNDSDFTDPRVNVQIYKTADLIELLAI